MTFEKTIPIDQELVNIFGVNDQNLNYLKSLFPNLEINVRGNVIYINGSTKDTQEATRILDEMIIMGSKNETIEIPDLELIAKIKNPEKLENSKVSQLNVIDNKFIKVKNLNQFKYLETIDNSTITFGIGPAGTGKTFLAVASAVKMYSELFISIKRVGELISILILKSVDHLSYNQKFYIYQNYLLFLSLQNHLNS